MWSRIDIKSYAKEFLKRHYIKAFLVCLIVTILGGSSGNSGFQWEKTGQNYYQRQTIISRKKATIEIKNPVTRFVFRKSGLPFKYALSTGIAILIGALSLALSIMVGNVLEVGKARFFLLGFEEEDADAGNLFSVFNTEEYFDILKTQFIRGLYTFLWTLLFVIPGIIKSYEYRMVPYILSEEPDLHYSDAIEISRKITRGHKMNMFVLDLSFIGWHLLGALFFGIGSIFVYPYEEATYARLYNILVGNDDNENEVNYVISE